ncbi:MAG TPA: polysaccharide deacetylase family protein [Fulvivirga sp.]|nr:polysaccharide deacetylase family protein [Fulvivirga sp.]
MNRILTLLSLLVLVACNSAPQTKKAGVCISFDDRSIAEWYQMSGLLDQYNAKVTFFITQFDSLTENEVVKLKQLQLNGHEIGSHGNRHAISENYIKEYGWNKYIDDEIIANKLAMQAKGFEPVSFAYPYGAKYWFTDYLISKYHPAIRSDLPVNAENDLTKIEGIFYKFDGDYEFYSMGFDSNYHLTHEMITKAMKRAKMNNEVLLLHGHVPDDGKAKKYEFSMELLEFILSEANRQGLVFYRFKDLVNSDQ